MSFEIIIVHESNKIDFIVVLFEYVLTIIINHYLNIFYLHCISFSQ